MSAYPVVAALAAAGIVGGLLLVVVGLSGTSRPARPPSRVRRLARRVWSGQGLSAAKRRTRRLVLGGAVAATAVVWLYTAIPVAGLVAGLAALGVPWLFGAGRSEQRAIARLEAVEVWTRRLADLVRTGVGLTQAIIVSTRDAPPAIAGPLQELAGNLRAGMDTTLALDRLAATLADASSDEVVVRLQLHAADRGQRLVTVLDLIADSIGREIAMRREVWASRADPRLTTRFMTVLTVVIVGGLLTNTSYTQPYRTPLGQLVLAVTTVVFAGLLAWIRRLSQPRRIPRLLAPDAGRGRLP